MGFYLVYGGDDGGFAEEEFQAADVEVRDANCFGFAGLQQGFHCFPRHGGVEVGEFEDAVAVEREEFGAGFEGAGDSNLSQLDNYNWVYNRIR